MPSPHTKPHPHPEADVWSVEGRFEHIIFSPKGAIEGVLIETDGVRTQFVCDAHDVAASQGIAGLHAGQSVVVEGTQAEPSPKGEPEHTVYRLVRLASVDGKPVKPHPEHHSASGKVTRFNYAKHGVANGVVLDTGDFIHLKPDGLERLGLKIGDKVQAEGAARPLATGHGHAVEARSVNGKPVGPDHG